MLCAENSSLDMQQIRASRNELDEADFNSSKSFKLVDVIPTVATDDERTANDWDDATQNIDWFLMMLSLKLIVVDLCTSDDWGWYTQKL